MILLPWKVRGYATALACALAAVSAAVPTVAGACGGFFQGPPVGVGAVAPVLQNAGRILFVRDAATKKSTVWVEVGYSGPPDQFGWVLPLPKPPTVAVGSSFVFDQLHAATVPFVGLEPELAEGCRVESTASCEFTGFLDGATASGGGAFAADPSEGQLGVTVLQTEQVGPYDTQVISGTSAAGVLAWLTQHGYQIPAKAKEIFDDHVKLGHVFVAVKLTSGASVREIRPIALTMDDAEPCVPLRLTSLAASADTVVQVWVAGPGRAIPKNHLHVQLNPMRLDLLGGLGNYGQILAEAIDEAGGRAFVTEFAGVLPQIGLSTAATAGPGEVLFDSTRLSLVGVAGAGSRCKLLSALYLRQFPMHSDVLAILEKHLGLAAAKGLKPAAVYSPTAGCVDPVGAPFDASAVVAELHSGFVDPVLSIRAAVAAASAGGGAKGRLTRLAMRISPDEMTKDPVFSFAPALPDVSRKIAGSTNGVCNGPGTTRVSLPPFGSWILQDDVSGPGPAHIGLDKRFSSAPSALVIELLDEIAPPLAIHPADIGVVDAAIANAHWNEPALPAGLVLKSAPPRWTPPPSDFRRQAAAEGGDSCAVQAALPRTLGLLLPLMLAVGLVGAHRRRG